ncbi:hypothetical protein [Paenibacillus mucilaginosus]|uniref:Uncharacterized protein n=1 Tax=Paenibacillus mucilaginosus (strain KNP414) TaxID=1036673 RepID=F8FGZ0_PAEMK|nr:hypothetical protein [Paenibacillus mucilaginosus]AEI46291.1 hypothetical protein KNP414_07805 [Paenibacillus mucilaginosus KNP414]MCG7213594.1 hypothetical protein [Paenibacillus mucilaginosus]WDM27591.1 hypothetical protein KCX80_35530 [Paenibacillus mucilaginosus]
MLRHVPAVLRLAGGSLLLGTGAWGWTTWHALLEESGGPDQGNELMFMIPYLIAYALTAAGLILLIQGLLRLRRRD